MNKSCFDLEFCIFVSAGAAWPSTGEETAPAAVWGAGTGSTGDGTSSKPVGQLYSHFCHTSSDNTH